jgi:hypothetical protein
MERVVVEVAPKATSGINDDLVLLPDILDKAW